MEINGDWEIEISVNHVRGGVNGVNIV